MPDTTFSITVTHHRAGDEAAHRRIRLTGEVDMSCCDQLRAAIVEAMATDPAENIIVDLDNVSFIDSVAVRTLLDGYFAAERAGTSFQVRHAHGLVHEVLSILGLLPILDQSTS